MKEENKRKKKKYYEVQDKDGSHISDKTDSEGWQTGLTFTDDENKLSGPIRIREVDPGIEKSKIERDKARSMERAAKSYANAEQYKYNTAREKRKRVEAEVNKIQEVRYSIKDLIEVYNWFKYELIPDAKYLIKKLEPYRIKIERKINNLSFQKKRHILTQTELQVDSPEEIIDVINKDTRNPITKDEYRNLVMQWVNAVIQKNRAEKEQRKVEESLLNSKIEGTEEYYLSDEKLMELETTIKKYPELMEPEFAQSLQVMLQSECNATELQRIKEVLPIKS